jgi:hypothetical protein
MLDGQPADLRARNDELHDLRGAVAYLQPHDVAQALLVRQVHRVAVMPMREQTLMDHPHGRLGRIPLGHGSFRRVRQPAVAQVKSQMAELARQGQDCLGLLAKRCRSGHERILRRRAAVS